MAISKNITFRGVEVAGAYIKVRSVTCTKEHMEFQTEVKSSADADCLTGYVFSCSYDIGGSNPIAQAYEHLKTLPEFSDATDC